MPRKIEIGKIAFMLMAGCTLVAAPALARGAGGTANMSGAAMGSMRMTGGMSGLHGNFGGNAASHMSTQGTLNTNGANATSRTFGTDRANVRLNNAGTVGTTGSSGTIITGSRIPVPTATSMSGRASTDEDATTGTAGGMSASHISAQGLANTNGPNATTKLHGRDRAAARKALHTARTTTAGTSTLTHSSGRLGPPDHMDRASGSMSGSTSTSTTGGMSASHISAQGLANTNGRNAVTKLHGRDRAAARMSAQGLAHSKASAHAKGSTDTDTDGDTDTDTGSDE